MSDVLSQYYRGITQQLQSEVDFINSLFQHQGVKGEGNEAILRDLLVRFIPKRYGVGTGVLVDRYGKQSRQCDIVIYDRYLYPSILALYSVHLFPVDTVYAVVEVKTTLNSTSARIALENIASVKSLDIITDSFCSWDVSPEGVALANHAPQPPMGYVFAYHSNVDRFETFKNWWLPKEGEDCSLFPTLVGCLDQGLVKYKVISQSGLMRPDAFCVPVMIDETNYHALTEYDGNVNVNGNSYPVKEVKGEYVPIDRSRVFLLFVLILSEMLALKKINPFVKFTEHYLKPATKQTIEC